jgi:hypothetical protein
MLFQVIHTHTNENCPARSPEHAKPFGEWWQSLKKTTGVKLLSGYVSPIDHTFYFVIEADDFTAVTRELGGLNPLGSGSIRPVISLDQALPLIESGIFRASK